jgi:diaminopimelate epimerase
MKLAKWQGLGNDYLIVEAAALAAPLTAEAIALLCNRHLGVGSDGILLHDQPSGAVPEASARMRIFNPDGSEPEMCGNGIRMFARYLARSGATVDPEFVVETLAGAIKPRLLEDDRVRVDMGHARFSSVNVDVLALARLEAGTRDEVVGAVLEAGGQEYAFTFVDVGNPHCVIQVDDPATFDVAGVGAVIEHHKAFPNRVNVEFIRVEADGSVRMRVWERGVGETQACGTGATAVGAAVVKLGLSLSPVVVHLLGGDLTIEVEEAAPAVEDGTAVTPERRVFMTGPAEEVFVCDLSPDLLRRLGWPAAADN